MKKIEILLRQKMLDNIQKRRKVFPCTNARHKTRAHLAEFLGENNFNEGAEIGVKLGGNAKVLLQNNPNLLLHCIDPWNAYNKRNRQDRQQRIYENCVENLKGYNVNIIRKTSMEALPEFKDRQLDFVYIDGNHDFNFAMKDILFWPDKVKSGGLIMCHDFGCFTECGVMSAVIAYTHSHNIRCYVTYETLPTAYWINP